MFTSFSSKQIIKKVLFFLSVFLFIFSFATKDTYAAPAICTVRTMVDEKEVSAQKVDCPLNYRPGFIFEDNKCYQQKKSGLTTSEWLLELCPGEIPTTVQRRLPVAGTYSFQSTADTVSITGFIDKGRNPEYKDYIIYFQWSPAKIPGVNNPNAKNHADFTNTNPPKIVASKVNDFGSYGITLTNITPNIQYNLREIIINDDKVAPTVDPTTVKDTTFLSTGGIGVGVKENFDYFEDFEKRSYRLLAPFPGLTVLMDPDLCAEQEAAGNTGNICDINDFLNFALMILIGLGAVLLVFRIMLEGFKYVTSDIPAIKVTTKSNIQDAFWGLLLILSAFIILNTINPKIVENVININRLEIGVEKTVIKPTDYKALTGETLKPKAEIEKIVDEISKEKGIEACIVKATIQAESNWRANAIGCDENVKSAAVPSRRAFVQSGIRLDGTKFSATNNAGSSVKNGCNFDISKASTGYGLDWRFSKGGGLMQVTVFPSGYNTTGWYQGVKEGGSHWSSRQTPFSGWQTIISTDANIRKGIDILKDNLSSCSGSMSGAFRRYQTGSCNPPPGGDSKLVSSTIAKKMSLYQSCMSMK